MDLVESKIACHLHRVRLLGSCPIKTCIIHYPPSTSHKNFKPNSLPKQNPLKRATAEDSYFQLPSNATLLKLSTNWKTFTKQLSQITPLFPSNIDNSNDLETAVDNLTTNIITVYNLASKPLHNKSTYFLPPPIKRLITQRNRARKNWQKYRPFSKHLYNRAQAILRKETKIYNESTWATELAALNTEDSSFGLQLKDSKKETF
ncbi:uncharacterized protein CEXT_573451 [Caerostris extrusa]|uniref:Uncharacterized protein n=1 Tax=Caerostris extrusa TaxID=172846 RepID=A0AAV4MNT4_CAEEX|nr:uncharacterized protein CEXT_573451 [Caerostris extrusa]